MTKKTGRSILSAQQDQTQSNIQMSEKSRGKNITFLLIREAEAETCTAKPDGTAAGCRRSIESAECAKDTRRSAMPLLTGGDEEKSNEEIWERTAKPDGKVGACRSECWSQSCTTAPPTMKTKSIIQKPCLRLSLFALCPLEAISEA